MFIITLIYNNWLSHFHFIVMFWYSLAFFKCLWFLLTFSEFWNKHFIQFTRGIYFHPIVPDDGYLIWINSYSWCHFCSLYWTRAYWFQHLTQGLNLKPQVNYRHLAKLIFMRQYHRQLNEKSLSMWIE